MRLQFQFTVQRMQYMQYVHAVHNFVGLREGLRKVYRISLKSLAFNQNGAICTVLVAIEQRLKLGVALKYSNHMLRNAEDVHLILFFSCLVPT